MKKSFVIFAVALSLAAAHAESHLQIFDRASFYDGYLVEKIPEDAPDQGYNRLYTSLNTVKLTDEQLDQIGDKLTLRVEVYPVCDNYDRIGSVNLALVPKGQKDYKVKYDASDPKRIEVARFITPFMNRNKWGDQARYLYQVDDFARILKDKNLREKYDLWLELMIFGVPYAAQKQVEGCADCVETFHGSVWLDTSDEPAEAIDSNILVPITIRTGDWTSNRGINNYDPECTDEVGKTVKTYKFDVPEDCVDGRVVLVMSNHGAAKNGEEYVRRHHYIYADDVEALTFIPGRPTCEPFRGRNTQGNGIYGRRPKTDAMWQSFSNWCPGDKIDIRYIDMGEVKAGEHSIRIEVPDAEFYGADGYFPVSMYFQGDKNDNLPTHPELVICNDNYDTSVRIEDNTVFISSPQEYKRVELYSDRGELLMADIRDNLDISNLPEGEYYVAIIFENGIEGHEISTMKSENTQTLK